MRTRSNLKKEIMKMYALKKWPKEWEYYLEDCWGGREQFSEREVESILVDLRKLRSGRPLAYVTGVAHFYGYRWKVGPGVLIPRPETEELVEWVSKEAPRGSKLLDVGVGSGCIAVSLSLLRPDCRVYGCDISSRAVEIARSNCENLGGKVHFAVRGIEEFSEDAGSWDVIVSNPPYVRPSELDLSVLEEPELALLTPEDQPIKFYEIIAEKARKLLCKSGWIYFELSEFTAEKVREMLAKGGWKNVEVQLDLQGKARMCRAQLAP